MMPLKLDPPVFLPGRGGVGRRLEDVQYVAPVPGPELGRRGRVRRGARPGLGEAGGRVRSVGARRGGGGLAGGVRGAPRRGCAGTTAAGSSP